VIACSTGNHGQSLAFAGRALGVKATIVVPEGNNPGKNASIRALGAELIEHGRDYDAAKAHCEQLAGERGARYVHSANEPDLIAGVGTIALEIFEKLPSPDVLLVPVGLGSGICGAAIVAAAVSPKTKIIGVQAAGASAVADSWRSGRTVSHPAVTTVAEGLATRAPAEMTLDIMRRLVHDIVLVEDHEIVEALRWILDATHNLVEPAGAATTAAAWKLRETLAGKTVVAVVSGANCDLRMFNL
jgi:threonine dehydratase